MKCGKGYYGGYLCVGMLVLLFWENVEVGKWDILQLWWDECGSKWDIGEGSLDISMAGVGYYFGNISEVWLRKVLEMVVGVCGNCKVEKRFGSV